MTGLRVTSHLVTLVHASPSFLKVTIPLKLSHVQAM